MIHSSLGKPALNRRMAAEAIRRRAALTRSIAAVAASCIIAFAASSAGAQSVLLQIRPRVGDTLAVRMDQQVEMTGVPVGCASGGTQPRNSPPARPCAEVTRHMTTKMEVFSRAIVRKSTDDATMLLAMTDSVRTSASSTPGKSPPLRRVTGPRGSIEFRVNTDGGAEVTNADASDELRAMFGQMPAMLPRKAVSVGEKWTREMRIPITTEQGAKRLVRATFQLDSLGPNGDVAHISMRGSVSGEHGDGSQSEQSGSLTGMMQLDRRLAWITETRASIDVRSVIKPATGPPMAVRTRVTQHLRAARAQ